MYRPQSFDKVYGQQSTVRYLSSRIAENSLPQFIIFIGEEGIGKTTLAKICAVELTNQSDAETIVEKNQDTRNVCHFRMSVNGGKDEVLKLLERFNTNMLPAGERRVIICDEVQNMSKQAMDALLNDTEYIPENVYLFMCTTDVSSIPKTLTSRATVLNLHRLKPEEMLRLLHDTCVTTGLAIEHSATAYNIIASYAEHKPRKALKVLESLGKNKIVSLAELKDFVQFRSSTDFKDITMELGKPPVRAIELILNLQYDSQTKKQFCDFLSDCVKLFYGVKQSNYDMADIKAVTGKVNHNTLVAFLYEVANIKEFDNTSLLTAFIRASNLIEKLIHGEDNMLEREVQIRNELEKSKPIKQQMKAAPTLDELLRNATKLT